MTDEPKRIMGEVAALTARGRERDRVAASKRDGRGPSPEVRPPALLAGVAHGVQMGHQNPVVRARVERIRAAMDAGRLTPAEGVKVFDAMSADEAAANALLAKMPAGRVPLEQRSVAPDPENPCAVDADGLLSAGFSLLSPSARAELRARRREWRE